MAASRKSRTQSPSSSSLFLKKTATTMRRRRRRTSWERSSSLIVSSAKPRALISVSDKTNLDKLASGLVALGFEVISTGGSAKFIQDKNIPVTSVDSVTSFPEMLDGRVKTLHPGIHGGILARRENETHMKQISEHNIDLIDVVVVNLYPFRETVLGGKAFEECVENIDIGGPAMIRAAAKNHPHVSVVVDPNDYDDLLENLKKDGSNLDFKKLLFGKAFQHCASSRRLGGGVFVARRFHRPRQTCSREDDFYDFVERVEIRGKSAPTGGGVFGHHVGRVIGYRRPFDPSCTTVKRCRTTTTWMRKRRIHALAITRPRTERASSSSTRIRVVLPRNLPPAVTCWRRID